jgi:hypothetical protein
MNELVKKDHTLIFEDISDFKKVQERFKQLINVVQSVKTPKEYIKKRDDGFDYPEFSYMLEQMNIYHPLREENTDFIINEKAGVVVAVTKIRDLITGELRTGVDAHRITIKKEARGKVSINPTSDIVDIGNDYKSASQEALRNAYSRFGICADVYKRILTTKPTPEQSSRFYKIIDIVLDRITKSPDEDKKKKIMNWQDSIVEQWKKCTNLNADEYLDKLELIINKGDSNGKSN